MVSPVPVVRSAESAGSAFTANWFTAALKGPEATPQLSTVIRPKSAELVTSYWNVRPPRNGLPRSFLYTVVTSVPLIEPTKGVVRVAKTEAPLTAALPGMGVTNDPGGSGAVMMANTGADVAMVN